MPYLTYHRLNRPRGAFQLLGFVYYWTLYSNPGGFIRENAWARTRHTLRLKILAYNKAVPPLYIFASSFDTFP
jgi:hypothetical protein